MTVERFVEQLARLGVETSAESPAITNNTVRNPYSRNRSRANGVRRHNLSVYLHNMQRVQPRLLLVGEALGYRGGGVTGVPFVSQRVLLTHPRYASWGFQAVAAPSRSPVKLPHSEASATILHAVCDQLGLHALHWNAFPLHPHRAGASLSNRKPTAAELAQGGRFLQMLLAQFAIEQTVAVGNSAEKALTALQIPHVKVRHPSHGGKQAFHDGLAALQR